MKSPEAGIYRNSALLHRWHEQNPVINHSTRTRLILNDVKLPHIASISQDLCITTKRLFELKKIENLAQRMFKMQRT